MKAALDVLSESKNSSPFSRSSSVFPVFRQDVAQVTGDCCCLRSVFVEAAAAVLDA